MFSSSVLILFACSFIGVLAKLPNIFSPRSTSTSSSDNYISSSWTDGVAKAKYNNGKGGEFDVTWTGNKGNFVCGKGWSPGGARYILFFCSSFRVYSPEINIDNKLEMQISRVILLRMEMHTYQFTAGQPTRSSNTTLWNTTGRTFHTTVPTL